MTTDARDVRPGTADAGPSARLRPLFAPRGVVVVGASRDSSKLGAVMARSLSAFPGPVAGVNPRDVAPDERRYAAVADAADALGVPLDLAVLCVPAAASAGA
ncbi:CoA-binding protein, partial [Amorphoplanes digitatis]